MKFVAYLILANLIYMGIASSEEKKLAIDPRCNENFLQAFTAQSECYVQGLSKSCVNLGLIAASGVGAGVKAYAFSRKLNEKLFKDFGDKYRAQLEQFAEFNLNKGRWYQKAEAEVRQVTAEEYDKVKLKIRDDYVKKYGRLEYRSDYAAMINKGFDAYMRDNSTEMSKRIKARMDPLINAEPNPFQKASYQVLTDYGPVADVEPNRNKISPFHQYRMDAYEKVFPEEMKVLRPFFDKLEVAFHNERAAVLNTSNPNYREDSAKKVKAAEDLRKQLEDFVEKSKNPRVKAFFAISESYLNDVRKIAPPGLLTAEQRKLLEESLSSKTNRAARMVRTSIGVGSGVVSAALMAFGVDLLGNALDKKLISKCQDKLKLTNDEVEFLSNGSVFSGTKVRGNSGSLNSECDEMSLEPGNLQAKLNEISTKYQGVPVGICNILISQQKRLMNSQDSAVLNDMSCQNTSLSNFETSGLAYAPDFVFNNGTSDVISGKWDPTINWIDAESLVVSVNGAKDIFKTEKLREDLKCAPNMTDGHFDKLSCPVKFILGCQGNQKLGSCNFVNTANSFRIVNATRLGNCTDLVADKKDTEKNNQAKKAKQK